jgi:BirA family biotin operon repressor/biotin-[acetyl-CoA-carboxylase] ligase
LTRPFDVARLEALRTKRGLSLGSPLTASDVTASTNDDALQAARAGAPAGTTFVTERQTHGRGRRGRSFYAEPSASLLCSVIVRPALPIERASGLSLAAGLAARRAIARALPALEAARGVRIKWPNDVWAGERKIAGVLAETLIENGRLAAVVIGVGVNVATTSFPPDLGARATSIALLGGQVDRELLLADLLDDLARVLAELERAGLGALHAELLRYDALLGKSVRVDDTRGVAQGIDPLGRLLVRCERGDVVPVMAGTVEVEDAPRPEKLQP